MNFQLTEERQMLKESLRRFFAQNQDLGLDEFWKALAELGVIGAMFSEKQGGYGGEGFDLSVVFEELGRAGLKAPLMQSGVLAGGLLTQLGNDDQQALVEQIIAGRLQLAFAHGEPRSRYLLRHVSTTAKNCDGGFRLDGHKSVVINAERAKKLIVSARTSGTFNDAGGISLFVVDKDLQGLQVHGYQTLDGVDAAEVRLENCVLPKSAMLGQEGQAFDAIEYQVARATAALCAESLGAMESAKELTVDYIKTRQQFGVAIGKFQALQHRMADVLIEIEQARSATINVCGHLEAERGSRELHVSAAKNLIGRVGRLVAEECIQLHGGIGMTQEYRLGAVAKRMIMIDHEWGDSDHHLQRFIELSRG